MSVDRSAMSANHEGHEGPAAARGGLDQADELQIRLILRTPQAQRIQAMLDAQAVLLDTWHRRLRRAHPELSDLDLCRLMFERLARNG